MVVAGPPSAVRLRLHQAPPENSCRPSVDVLFRSVAEIVRRVQRGRSLAFHP